MCGIFGYCNVPNAGQPLLREMASEQIHRGPDSEGYYIHESFGFGIRRLSVIDLATGNQPISNENKTIWVVCNGEIYNYRELNILLRKKGHTFYTKSDVECIVHLYEEYGIEFLSYLNGMFGMALYDSNNKCLYVARDRLGIKPLYYSSVSNHFLFGSELRSILATDIISKELDWNALSIFLDQLYIPTPYSPFSDIRKLQPGHYLKIDGDNNHPKETRYWDLNSPPSISLPKSEEELIDTLTFLLRDANKLQIRADVPICAFLSGGVDSSAVVAFAAMQASLPLRTYHVFFNNSLQKMDERHFASSVAERYGTIHTEVGVDREDFDKLIPRLIWHLEEPFGDLASVPTFIISEMAKKSVTVCLNGSGGDELFGGYPHHSHRSLFRNRLLAVMRKCGIESGLRKLFSKTDIESKWTRLFPLYVNSNQRLWPEDKGGGGHGGLLNKVLIRDIDGYLQSNVLFLLDKIAMSVSLEGRVPLLDHRFVEVAAHIPFKWKCKNGERKYIFKKMLEPFLPGEVLYRKKEGFGAPVNDWFDNASKAIFQQIIMKGTLRKNGLLIHDCNIIENLGCWELWKVACLEMWYSIFVDSFEKPIGQSLQDYSY